MDKIDFFIIATHENGLLYSISFKRKDGGLFLIKILHNFSLRFIKIQFFKLSSLSQNMILFRHYNSFSVL